MKTFALITASTLLVIADTAPDVSVVDPIARLTAVGVLGFIVIWLVTRTLPDMTKRWEQSMDKLERALTELRLHCTRRETHKEDE